MTESTHAAGVLQALIELEERAGLFERTALGVRYWHAVRNDVYQETLHALGLSERAHLRLEELPARELLRPPRPAQLLTIARRSLWRGLPRAELLVANHPRHVPAQGRYICPYSQPLLDGLPQSRVLIEGQFHGRYFLPSAAEEIRYVDAALALGYAAFRGRELGGRGLRAREISEVRELASELQRAFGRAPRFEAVLRRVRTAVLATLALEPRYERLLDRVQPKLVVEVIGYRLVHLILAGVARRRGIPVAELQHGVLGRAHGGYNFAPGRRPEAFPDHVLLFGDVWRELTPGLPLPPEHTPAIGYAWLQQQCASHARSAPRSPRRLLFLSQRAIGAELSRVAVDLRRLAARSDWHIVYRLHPSEESGWRDAYPELAASAIEVEPARARALHASQADADAQAGVYSTALLEGLAFGLPSFLVALPGHEHLAAFVTRGLLEPVADAPALLAALERAPQSLARDRIDALWSPDPSGAFRAFVERIAPG